MTTDTFTNVEKRPVIASDTAEAIGSVKGFVLDPAGRAIQSVHVDGHGKRAVVLEWSAIDAFGADAVMAHSADAATRIDDDHQKDAVKGTVTMIGTRVLTVGGREIGTVSDVEFDTASGAVVRIRCEGEVIDAERVRSLGSYALVVSDPSPDGR